MELHIKPIGIIHSPFQSAVQTPIQPAAAGGTRGRVELFPEYAPGLLDLDGFERIWLIYWFDLAAAPKLRVKPYLDDREHGLFATRAPARPNPIGISSVKLVAVEGSMLIVEDIDILDGTPLLDIKPYAPQFDGFDVRRTGWLEHKQIGNTKADDRFHRKENP